MRHVDKKTEANTTGLSHQNIISTAELFFAAYLKARYRFPLVEIAKSSAGRVTWTFELQEKDEATLTNEFWRGGHVPAMEYAMEL